MLVVTRASVVCLGDHVRGLGALVSQGAPGRGGDPQGEVFIRNIHSMLSRLFHSKFLR